MKKDERFGLWFFGVRGLGLLFWESGTSAPLSDRLWLRSTTGFTLKVIERSRNALKGFRSQVIRVTVSNVGHFGSAQ